MTPKPTTLEHLRSIARRHCPQAHAAGVITDEVLITFWVLKDGWRGDHTIEEQLRMVLAL
jgi:hypothetical protein